jgi:diadenosine tetraphosphate (Ap4A) HIT family hydrolase
MAKECMTCKSCSLHDKKLLESSLVDHGGTVFSSLVRRPNSKAHANIITKKHTEDLRTITPQEWADILPVFKETIKKIDKTYQPLGYRISIPVGEKAGQNVPYHFYMRIVPKYKKD